MQENHIRKSILDAAEGRFSHYGYSKTTVAEIAADCGMSVGNIYRFFDNKEAIAMAGVEKKMNEKLAVCEQATDPTSSAVEQLRQYMLARLRHTHQMSCGGEHLFELVELITRKHADLIQHFDECISNKLTHILQQGIERGELRSMDAAREAGSIMLATTVFCVPVFMREPLSVMETRLNDLIDLLYQGLKT